MNYILLRQGCPAGRWPSRRQVKGTRVCTAVGTRIRYGMQYFFNIIDIEAFNIAIV